MLIGLEIAKPRWGGSRSSSSAGSLTATGGVTGGRSYSGGLDGRLLDDHVALWMREFDRQGSGHITEEMFYEGVRGGGIARGWGFGLSRALPDGGGLGWPFVQAGRSSTRASPHAMMTDGPRGSLTHQRHSTPARTRARAGVSRWVAYKMRALRDEPRYVKQKAKDPAAAAHSLLVHKDDTTTPLLAAVDT